MRGDNVKPKIMWKQSQNPTNRRDRNKEQRRELEENEVDIM